MLPVASMWPTTQNVKNVEAAAENSVECERFGIYDESSARAHAEYNDCNSSQPVISFPSHPSALAFPLEAAL